jgi:mannose-6-phosphate isomerase-like protein (cupin superfamily)
MKSLPISIETARRYAWGQDCDGWHLVQTESLSIIEERMPPEAFEKRHLHTKSRQFFFVLGGELTVEVDGEEHILRPSAGIEIAPGQAHQVSNRGKWDTWFMVTSQPPSHGDRIDA